MEGHPTVALRVDASADPKRAEQIIVEEARKVLHDLPGETADQALTVAFATGDNFLEFTLSVQIQQLVAQSGVQQELRKRLFRPLGQEGIEYPNGRACTAAQQVAEFRQGNPRSP